jgi:IPT/TIG domain
MNRSVRLTAVVLFVGLAGACEKGGALQVDRVEPGEGITPGGDQIVIHGSGFQPGKTQVEVRFGRRRAEHVAIDSASKISVVTPAGDKGPVDVTLSFDNGAQFKIPSGFKYVNPEQNANVRRAFLSGKANEKK